MYEERFSCTNFFCKQIQIKLIKYCFLFPSLAQPIYVAATPCTIGALMVDSIEVVYNTKTLKVHVIYCACP